MSKPEPAAVFAALGDPVRLELLSRLDGLEGRDGIALGRLVAGTGITRQGATKHLQVLERAGLVTSAMAGRERRVFAAPEGLAAARDGLERIAAGWEEALDRLKAHVERGRR